MSKLITLGELLVRFATQGGIPLAESNALSVHYGGSEANVSIALTALGHETTILSKVPDNPLGKAAIQHLRKHGVNTSQVLTGGERIGGYYVEVGAGLRATAVTYDRKHSSFAEMKDWEWSSEGLFAGASTFHVSGITPALSPEMATLTLELVKQAKAEGLTISFDSNYRAKLWTTAEASAFCRQLLPMVDYCSMGELDAQYLLGVAPAVAGLNEEERLTYYYQEMQKLYPTISVFYSTIREVIATDENNLRGTLWQDGALVVSKPYHLSYIVDRIGGGDAFAAGTLHGLIKAWDAQAIVEFSTGLSVLKHTIAGDAISMTEAAVLDFIETGTSKINR